MPLNPKRILPKTGSLSPMQSEGKWLPLSEIWLSSASLMLTEGGSHLELNKTAHLKASTELDESDPKW